MLFRRLFSPRLTANDRLPRSRQAQGLEQLEDRLCLGGIGSLPVPLDASMPIAGNDSDSELLQSHVSYQSASNNQHEPLAIHYDFRSQSGFVNQITAEQEQVAAVALSNWADASQHRFRFVRDTESSAENILNIGVGDLLALDYESKLGGVLGLGGGKSTDGRGPSAIRGTVWLDSLETWDTQIGNGNPAGTHDFFTVVAHEVGHALGYQEALGGQGIMSSQYQGELSAAAISQSVQDAGLPTLNVDDQTALSRGSSSIDVSPLMDPQLTTAEVKDLLDRASAVSSSENAIIAVVDRGGKILGVRTEAGVGTPPPELLSFMIDGAVAKARTAAFFANDQAPLTSRTVRFISQSTVTQREIESNPNSTDPTKRGPGFVAPIGLGGHFPPEIAYTPPVDLFAIEHTNRDSLIHAGANGIRENGGGDDITLTGRFDATFDLGKSIAAPESYGFVSGLAPTQQSRGIATLPGGIPLFRDTDTDGVGDTVVGGIGVFFPGQDGYATFEQGFDPTKVQSEYELTNSALSLEAEVIALVAAGGSIQASMVDCDAPVAKFAEIAGVAPVDRLDLPFGNITLVGIELEVVGPKPGTQGVRDLVNFAETLTPGAVNGTERQVTTGGVKYLAGASVPDGWLVTAKDGVGITAAEVNQIIDQGIIAANRTRAAIRLPISQRTKMVFAVTDMDGEVVGLYRMPDATVFSIDVAVAKARNTAYYANETKLNAFDKLDDVDKGVALSNRTFRFLAEPRFPSGIDGTEPGDFSILNNSSIDPQTARNKGGPATAAAMSDTVLGFDAFNPGRNFHDSTTSLAKQNGVVFFPGSTPLYRNGVLIGGFGVSGDGVDQDDVVAYIGAQGFLPQQNGVTAADEVFVDGVRLPYQKFLRNPFG
jgi:uncharacterized protein GlcG (DUF336 family)